MDNRNLVKKVVFPLEVLPWVSLLSSAFHALVIDYLPVSLGLGEMFRSWVEKCREAKRVRAFDVVNDSPGAGGDPDGAPPV